MESLSPSLIRIAHLRARAWIAEPGRVVVVMLGIATLLALAMALASAINDQPARWSGPPDEYLHRSAARYYEDHWLPPKVGSRASLDSYSRDYGYSYLNGTDPVYFFVGKFAAATRALFSRDDVAFRVFNVLLLGALALLCARRLAAAWVFVPLLLTPQVWYIFSYFNGDAFPLFLSVLAAYQLAVPQSAFNRSLDSRGTWTQLRGLVPIAVCLALIALSKKNYYVFLAYVPAAFALLRLGPVVAACIAVASIVAACAYLRWIILSPREIAVVLAACGTVAGVALAANPLHKSALTRLLFKCAVLAALAGVLVLSRYWLDAKVQGSLGAQNAAIGVVQEELAKPDYKPSKIYSGNPETFRGLALRARGVRLTALFKPPWNWQKEMLLSSTGHYGWLEYRSPAVYYLLLGLAYLALIAHFSYAVVRSRDSIAWASYGLLLAFSTLCVGVSLWQAWENDFQAQGRYLFPIVGMMGIFLYGIRRHLGPRWMMAIVACCFLLSVYSFLFTGLWDIPKRF